MGTGTRWWENYLVRYFMPSIAGIVAVNWLTAIAGDDLRQLLWLPKAGQPLDGSSLTLLVLYGNLFCYVASYPILVFHATRVLDFGQQEVRWRTAPVSDGYLATIGLGTLLFLATITLPAAVLPTIAFIAAAAFAVFQLSRLRRALQPRWTVDGLGVPSSPMFALAYALARRRGLREERVATSSAANAAAANSQGGPPDLDLDLDEDAKSSREKTVAWRGELVDTYRHMREHGNSAFIFLLELVLAGLVYCLAVYADLEVEKQLSAIGILFAVWALPSVFVHMAAQHIERRFSQLEQRM